MRVPGVRYDSPHTFRLSQRLQLLFVPRLVTALAKLLLASNRIEVRAGHLIEDASREHGCVILVVWHEVVLPFSYHFRGSNIHAMASQSFDGELAARMSACFGFESVRGSSSKGGSEGLRELQKASEQVPYCGLTVDGPRGPRRVAKPGAAILSARTGYPIVPAACGIPRAWRMKSWDRMLIPKPFGRVILAFGSPILAPQDASPQSVEKTRLELESALNGMHEALEREVGDVQEQP